MVWNGLIRSLLECSIYIFLGALLNLKYGNEFDDMHVMINYVISVLVLTFMFWFTFSSVVRVIKHSGNFNSPEFSRFKELVDDLRPNAGDFATCFSGIFVLRRFLLVAIVVFLENAKI